MALNSINTNIAAYFAQQNINKSNNMTSSSIGRLSSGNRIVRAADDVAAMSVGTSLRTQVSTLRMGLLNASQGSSMLQVADGALSKIQDMLLRQKALATQATSGSLTAAERGFLNQEFQNLTEEIDRLVDNTNFNGVNLLGGGLGTSASLVRTNALAASATAPSGDTDAYSAASAVSIDAIDVTTGAVRGAGAGLIELTDSDGTTLLTNEDYLNVNSAVYGGIEKFEFSNVIYGASAMLTVTMNGVEFTGTIADGEGNALGEAVLSNGTTNLSLQTTDVVLTNEATVQNSLAQMYDDFQNTFMMSAQVVGGVDFNDTALEGAIGTATTGVASIRIADSTNIDIGNFKYVSNAGTGEHVITVQVNGETWTATGVDDVIDEDILQFEKGNGEFLRIDLTGQTSDIGVAADNNTLLENPALRAEFINALNIGFGKAGSGVDFALGTEQTDSLRVQIDNSSTTALYGGQSLNVTSVSDAQEAGEALNTAIATVTAIRADVGAMQSRFDFASANIEISLQNQDAARGVLLDTDIAAESSAYATSQVQLQAGIAVLAQANLLPQNLLKLIG